MQKQTINVFIIVSAVLFVAGIGLMIGGSIGGTTVYDPSTNTNTVTSVGNSTLVLFGTIFFILSWVPYMVAWIGAMISLARLQQWAWFVFMLVFGGFCLIVYLFAGPETPKVAQYPQYPQYQQPPQEPQPYQPHHHWQD